jgi:hypothetical protein
VVSDRPFDRYWWKAVIATKRRPTDSALR